MMETSRGTKTLVLAAMALCTVGSLYGAKADDKNNNGGLRVAVVDPQRLINEDMLYQSKVNDLEKTKTNVETELQTVSNNYLLSEADQTELTKLVVKESGLPKQELTADEKSRKAALLAKEKAASDELDSLSQNRAQLTAQQSARMTDLIGLREATARRAQDRGTSVQKDLQTQASDNMRVTLKAVHDTLAKVAKEKGYNLVLSNEVAWYADSDLTDETLKQLNRKQQ